MTVRRLSLGATLIATLIASDSTIAPALPSDRSEEHAVALSYRYGAYTKPGNIAAGQTVVIETPEGSITCTGGSNREYTGKYGPEGRVKRKHGGRSCYFNWSGMNSD